MWDASYCEFVRVFVCLGAVAAYGTREGSRFLVRVQAHERARRRASGESAAAWCTRTLGLRARAERDDDDEDDDDDDDDDDGDAALSALYAHVRSGAIGDWARVRYEYLLSTLDTTQLRSRPRGRALLAVAAA